MDFALTTEQLRGALLKVCEVIAAGEPMLTEADAAIGDGDHGQGMKTGFEALAAQLRGQRCDNPYDLFYRSGVTLVRAMGGASGVLFGTLFIGGLDYIRNRNELNTGDLCAFFGGSLQAIKRRGGTDVGDKTMIDALAGAVAAMNPADDLLAWSRKAWEGAARGAESTRNMLPRAGRAKNFRERALGYPDPGALSTSLFFEGIYHYFRDILFTEGD